MGLKAINCDIYGLLCAMYFHNLTRYLHIVGLSFHFYAHIGADHKAVLLSMSKVEWI